ncbi:MAG: LLM class F420-dependent oxidoreductase [Alphaproteobacteria bacterium]|jgi:F420-dependent oxidoreductase-like protein|nr:LLM class F420-dependent oxidoreductase [Rhodospirillaceae bacterium]MDP6407562.1 LLM class F420-dependent oxidoreductase [Alphaproteobacteria bacterium]MDP6624287.1 LLM class F420-dependent oxidoreductase [Alphaproteobacteria bacterium]
MRLGLVLGATGARYSIDMDLIAEAESLGFDSVWFSEAWGNDALTPAAWALSRTSRIKVGTAIIQMQARTPAMAAMTAMTLQSLSGNRFVLGIGPSGPQVIEGWHGVPFGRPLERTREYVAIIRQIIDRAAPLEHHGYHYQIPYRGEGSSGLGKPLKSILHGDPALKIYTGAIAPGGVRTAAEVADGFFPFIMVPERFDVFQEFLDEGFAKAGGGKGLEDFDVAPFVRVSIGDDLEACRAPIKQTLALYIGGMGARAKNFYNDFAKRLGYADAAAEIQDLFLDGKRAEAAAKVPDKLVDDVALIGPKSRIVERLSVWQAAAAKGQVGTLVVAGATPEALRIIAEEVL